MKYVVKKITALDETTKKCSSQITLLQERRTALISAAVNGKIDVRNFKAEENHAAQERVTGKHRS